VSECRLRIAVLGATGHVGKCLTAGLATSARYRVVAVARDAAKLEAFLAATPGCELVERQSFEDPLGDCHTVVNCVGIGDPAGVRSSGADILELTATWDAYVLDYLKEQPGARCVSFSSGAAYGGDFDEPVSESSSATVPINAIRPSDFYGIAKLASEARHRGARDLPIVDLRLFGLFSRYIDPAARYFMTDVYRAIADGTDLLVGPESIRRDYVDPGDLVALVEAVIGSAPFNDVYDVYSRAPAEKFELLEHFASRYGLSYDVRQAETVGTATGVKPHYYSSNRRAASVGYLPTMTSIESVTKEIDSLLESRSGGVR
jgi:nucleoside-diphosphate-sugar epimerase